MIQDLITQISDAIGNPYLTLYVISIIPIIELRGAILFMPYLFDSIQEMMLGMLCCIAGSTTVIVPLILITRPFLRKLRRSKWFSKIGKRMEANLADRAESAYSEEKNEKIDEIKQKHQAQTDFERRQKVFGIVRVRGNSAPYDGGMDGFVHRQFFGFPRVESVACGVFRQYSCRLDIDYDSVFLAKAICRRVSLRICDFGNRNCGDALFFALQTP